MLQLHRWPIFAFRRTIRLEVSPTWIWEWKLLRFLSRIALLLVLWWRDSLEETLVQPQGFKVQIHLPVCASEILPATCPLESACSWEVRRTYKHNNNFLRPLPSNKFHVLQKLQLPLSKNQSLQWQLDPPICSLFLQISTSDQSSTSYQ